MDKIFLITLGASALLLIIRPLLERGGILHYPAVAGIGSMGLLFVQALGIMSDPDMVPPGSLPKALLMCTLCNVAIYAGWYWKPSQSWRRETAWRYPMIRVYWAGIAVLAVGAFGVLRLTALEGGIIRSLSVDKEVSTWSGLPVIYLFFACFSQAGVAMIICAAMRMRDSLWRVAPAVPFVLLQAASVVFGGRRTVLVELAVFALCILWFWRGYTPPKLIVFAGAAVVIAAIYIFPIIRDEFQIGAEHTKIDQFSLSETSRNVLAGEQTEFWEAVYLIQITDVDDQCMMGAGIYNLAISLFVPKILVGGVDAKAKLYSTAPSPGNSGANSYGWTAPEGVHQTGPASVFTQFSYFGAILFGLLARAMRYLWVRASEEDDPMAQCLYLLFLPAAIAALTSDLPANVMANAPWALIAPILAFRYARVEKLPYSDGDEPQDAEPQDAVLSPGPLGEGAVS